MAESGSRNSTVTVGSIVIRCYEFDRMMAFWQEALHYVPTRPAHGGWGILRDPKGRGPRISLDQVSARRTGRGGWLHLDLYTTGQPHEVEPPIGLAARRYPWRCRARG